MHSSSGASVKYLTFLPIVVLILLFACSDLEPERSSAGARSAEVRGPEDGAASALTSPVCEALRKELGAARSRLAADSSNVRVRGRAAALGALTKDACGMEG